MKPEIQIYVPSCNYGRYLAQALDSVVNQSFQRWHCFIIDEKSSDETAKVAEGFVNKYGSDKFEYVRNKERLGLQKLANWVFKTTKAKYVIRLDADDFWMPQILENLYTALNNNRKAAIAFGSFQYISDEGEYLDTETSIDYLDRYKSGLDAPHGACTLIDKGKFLSEGLYDEEVDAQDGWDLWLKCHPKYEFIALNEPLFFYRQHKRSLSRNTDRIFNARRKLLRRRLSFSKEKKAQVYIPISGQIDVTAKDVQKHLAQLISSIKASKYCLEPIISFDNVEHLVELENNELKTRHICTNGKYAHGMNPFSLLDEMPICDDGKMWLNFNSNNIDGQLIDDAFNLFWNFNLDTCISVIEQREPVFKLTGNGLKKISNGRYANYKLKADELWRMNNILVISRVSDTRSDKDLCSGFFEMSVEESTLLNVW